MKKADIEAFYANLAAAMPEPKGELDYINPYTFLVAVVLSAQATDVAPIPIRPNSFEASSNWRGAVCR